MKLGEIAIHWMTVAVFITILMALKFAENHAIFLVGI
jgi:hypothetical protein